MNLKKIISGNTNRNSTNYSEIFHILGVIAQKGCWLTDHNP